MRDRFMLRGIGLDIFMKPMDYDTEYDRINESKKERLRHDVAALRRAHGAHGIHTAPRGAKDRVPAA